MMQTNKEYALKTAIELTTVNIQSCELWISPEIIVESIEHIYNFLAGEGE